MELQLFPIICIMQRSLNTLSNEAKSSRISKQKGLPIQLSSQEEKRDVADLIRVFLYAVVALLILLFAGLTAAKSFMNI